MGCFDSKMDSKRKALADDWTGSDFAFAVGGIATLDEFCPLDKLVLKFCGGEGKELKDGLGGAENKIAALEEAKGKELGGKIFEALKKLHGDYKGGKDDGEKKVFGKYTAKEAFEQIDFAVKKWCEKSGLEHKLEEEAPATAPDGMEMAAAMEEAMEGGEEMMGEMMAAAAPKKETPEFDATFGECAKPEDIPKLLAGMCVCYPAFGDAVKAQVLDHEFGGSGPEDLGGVAAASGAFVDAQEKEGADCFGCAWLTEDELADLKEAAEAKTTKALVFPGLITAWADKDSAVGNAGECPSGKKKVVFTGNFKAFKVGDKALVIHRQFAKIKELKEEDGGHTCELEDFADAVFESVAAWTEKVKALAAAGTAVAEAGMEAAMEAMGDKPDEMMMDPPAE